MKTYLAVFVFGFYLCLSTVSAIEETILTASDGVGGDSFGLSVSVSDDYVVVGAPDDDDNGIDSGSVYIYHFNGVSWDEQKLIASDGELGDFLGVSVAISQNRVIAGAHYHGTEMNGAGAAYIYEYNGSVWEETKLTASDAAAYDVFGLCVAIDGDTAVVGARYNDDNGQDSGSIYIFEYNGTDWIETKITASNGMAGDQFGSSVAVSGDYVVAGAFLSDALGMFSGAAYIYKKTAKGWEETRLTASDGAANERFGSSMSVSGNRVVVGAPSSGASQGSTYIYTFNGSSWDEQKITASDGEDYNHFGSAVSISGDYVSIGAYGDNENGINSGSTYIYHLKAGSTVETKIIASDGREYQQFGISVCIDQDKVVVGATEEVTMRDEYTGSAYVYTGFQSTAPTETPAQTVTPTYTPSNTPTSVPTATPTPSFSPEPTQTPGCTELSVKVWMPSDYFTEGDPCGCKVYLCNPGVDTYPDVPLFVILDVLGTYFFAPQYDDFSNYTVNLAPGQMEFTVLDEFAWPKVEGSGTNISWISAMTDPAITELFGGYDTFSFGWGD